MLNVGLVMCKTSELRTNYTTTTANVHCMQMFDTELLRSNLHHLSFVLLS